MNGIKYFRLISGMKIDTLAKKTGLSTGTIKNLEKADKPSGISAASYLKVSNALQVSPDKLIKSGYPDSGSMVPKRAPYPAQTGNAINHIFIYRREKNISCQQLADILGLTSRERARQLCSTEVPSKKHLETLAKHENISIEKFKRKYSFRGD